jgi:hypothetical protein
VRAGAMTEAPPGVEREHTYWADDDNRTDPPWNGDERATLEGFLDYHRDTLAWKCSGLTDAQLRERAVPPSALSLLGLVRHLADVERSWFQRGVAGLSRSEAPPISYSDEDPDGEFTQVDQADVTEAFETWRAECRRSREITAATPSLDTTFHHERFGKDISLRCSRNMVEEYCRHNGHADLLRERIDGSVGE